MREYELKRGQSKKIEGEQLSSLMTEVFGACEKRGDAYVTKYGALSSISVQMKDAKTLVVDTVSDKSASTEVAGETIKRFNTFLERVTGFTTKQRAKRAQEALKKAAGVPGEKP
ncbi:MAG: DUF5611 family protein [Euryarchaeota archaeon]|nr:DUF5611 family protein [Euryarchaeota archaeon]